MIIKKKIRDITKEEYKEWYEKNCRTNILCENCPFNLLRCNPLYSSLWYVNKGIFSEEFLNQEIIIEKDILTEKEKEYLSNVIKPFRDRVINIEKRFDKIDTKTAFIILEINSISIDIPREYIELPYFKAGTMYKNMEREKQYTLEELGL